MRDDRRSDRRSVDNAVEGAVAASTEWESASLQLRSAALRYVADRLDSATHALVPIARSETHLDRARLESELQRTTGQLRFLADHILTGRHLRITMDIRDGGVIDIRRTMVPVGPVAVFAASNFPFAFSVAGGDTASALAAGCTVVVKTHPGHPMLSAAVFDVVSDALVAAGAPEGTIEAVGGFDAGVALVAHPLIRAGAFTGSTAGGRALFDVAARRAVPIPFYGELGSINPVFVSRGAAAHRADAIAAGFAESYTRGSGQFCTKPGIIVVPAGFDLPRRIADHVASVTVGPLLTAAIRERFDESEERLLHEGAFETLVAGPGTIAAPAPALFHADAARALSRPDLLVEERFGPSAIVVEYGDDRELAELTNVVSGTLTATIHAEPDEDVRDLLERLRARAGRLIWNDWPTGVTVSHAMQHGGPYPSSTSPTSTSVGSAAIERFLRPVSYQSFPQSALPLELRNTNSAQLERSVNGHVSTAEVELSTPSSSEEPHQ